MFFGLGKKGRFIGGVKSEGRGKELSTITAFTA
jgi:hypothetical protein